MYASSFLLMVRWCCPKKGKAVRGVQVHAVLQWVLNIQDTGMMILIQFAIYPIKCFVHIITALAYDLAAQ